MKNIKIKYFLFLVITIIFYNSVFIYSQTYEEYKNMYDKGSVEKAVIGLKKLYKENPRHRNIADIEFILAENEENYMKAIDAFKNIYEKRTSFSRRAEAGYNAGNLYLLNNGYNNAVNMFAKVLNDYPDSEYAILSKLKIASIKLKLGDKDEVSKIYKEIVENETVKKNEEYYEALFGLANTYFQMERYYEALGNYNRLQDESKNFKERAFVLYRLALCYESTGVKDKAISTYNLVINVYPNTQSAILAAQRLKVYASSEQMSNTYSVDKKDKKQPPVIYKSETENIYQLGRFRDKDKAQKLLDIVSSIGYKSYIVESKEEGKVSYVVRLAIYNDKRNIDELRKRLGSENIPFFKVN